MIKVEKGKSYTLTEAEQNTVKHVILKRNNYDASIGINSTLKQGKNVYENGLKYYGAEVAFANLANVCFDLDYKERRVEDGFLHNKMSYDTKHTVYPNGMLTCDYEQKKDPAKRCDVYPLMTGEFPTFTYRGYATAKALFRDENLVGPNDKFPRKVWALSQEHLHDD